MKTRTTSIRMLDTHHHHHQEDDWNDTCRRRTCRKSPPGTALLSTRLLLFACLLLGQTLLTTASSSHQRRMPHRRRDASEQPISVVFRYQCPQGCLCVPDIVDIELLIVSCRWPHLRADAFDQFPRNGTKSLSIQCTDESPSTEEADAREAPLLAKSRAFAGFSELRELKISGCQTGQQLAADLLHDSVPRLRSLWISQMRALERLEPQFLEPLAQLEKLTLAETGLRQMPRDGLCQLRQLQVLNLSGNMLESARLGILMSRPAGQSPCQLDQLLMLDLSANAIRVLGEQDLRPFPSLRQLSLRANGLVEVQADTFRSGPVPLLQHLDLSANLLSELPVGLPEGLLQLDLAGNRFSTLPAASAQLAGLTKLNLSGNAIRDEGLLGTSLQSSGLEQLDLSWNQLQRIPVELFAESADSLRNLALAGNAIERLEPGQLQNLSSLHELDLASNRLASLPSEAFDGLVELALLQLANNSIREVHAEVFQELGRSLHTLNMAQNQLTELPVAVGRLNRVKRMDLSRNLISKAYKFVLNKLPVLARLDLSQNALESVDSYVFKDCDHLQELNLRANRLQALSADAFEKCPKLKRLDLADNQLTSLGPALTLLGALRSVNLTGNGLEELNWTQFPPDLLEILANDNKIRRIATLGQSETEEAGGGDGRKLKKLELKRNLIARLSTDALSLALEELDLSENQLTHVANSSFHGMAQLKTVNLRANKLRTIPRQLFDQTVGANAPFGRLWIAENPLECNCEMGWLLNASKEGTAGTGGVRDIAEAECVVPLTGQRKPVAQAMPSDFLCPYSQICEPGCLCCQYQNCDCKSRCPKGCQCFRDWHSATNVVKCSGQQANQEEFSLRELPMQASHILLSGLNIPVLQSHDFLGRDRLQELHVNSSQIQTIQPSAFNTLMNLKSLHLADNKLKHFNGDEGYRTLNIRLLNLANNQILALDTRLIAMAPQLEQLFLEGNVFEELPTYLRSPSGDQLRQLSLAANPFRCDCSYTGRFDTPHWLARNRLRVIDADRVQCVENVTRAIQRNDTTILTGLPNVDDDLFAMSMFRFLDEENRTLCVDHTGVFGIGGPFDVLMFFMAMAALLLLLPMLMLLLIRPKWFESMLKDPKELRKTRKQQEQPLLKENNNSLSSTHSPTINGNSPLPPKPTVCHGVCDTFVCYSKKDEQMVREFRKRYSNMFNNICLLHECGAYQADRAYISDSLENLIKNSRLLVLFLSHEFMETEWNMPQLSTCLKTHFKGKSHILFILSNEMDERDKDNLPDELGKNIRISSPGCRTLTIAQNHPRFWAEIDEILYGILGETTARYGSPALSDTSESHIYSEYSQIPPVPSQML